MPVLTAPEPISMCHRRFACAFRLITHLPALAPPPFPQRSPPRLLNAAAWSGLKPAPAGRLREASSHLQHSYAGRYAPATRHTGIRIFDPAVTQRLIAQVVHVLEKRQACHQLRRQRRAAGAIRIDRSELRLQKPPIDRARKLHQRMRQIDDKPSRERNRSCSPVSCRSRGRIAHPPSFISRAQITASNSEESQKQFARKPQRRRPIPAKTIALKIQSPISFNALEILHGRPGKHLKAVACCYSSKPFFVSPSRAARGFCTATDHAQERRNTGMDDVIAGGVANANRSAEVLVSAKLRSSR